VTENIELAIVGAGPAGVSAAVQAAGLGLPATLIDAYPQPGGQYYKQLPVAFEVRETADNEGHKLLSKLAISGTHLQASTDVWGIFPSDDGPGYLLCLYGPPGTPRRLVAEKVILAPGAYDRPLSFPGWTLPGVMTAGAAQVLIKSQRILPGSRVLLSGTGPLQWALASQLVEGGAKVVAILDANPFPWGGWRHLPAFWGQGQRLREGLGYGQTLRKAQVPIFWGHTVKRAEGQGHLERVMVGEVRNRATQALEVDTLCLGYGFLPALQLSLQAGCEHIYLRDQYRFAPVRDESLQTTLPGIYLAGDGAGIGGKDVALLEGRLAAMAAAQQLGYHVPEADQRSVRRRLKRERRFARALDALFPFPVTLWKLMTDDTIVCRCEEITVAQVRQAVAEGATTPIAVKNLTRAGMGRCQGRMCANSLAHLVARESGQSIPEAGLLRPRPPVLPIPLEGLLEEEQD
jgi:NADPH-dependent 2,4-dienoyl-CoA reductase/sulfur reductase-like enzyme